MEIVLIPEHRKLIEDIAETYGLGKCDVLIEPRSEKGDGYSGRIIRIRMEAVERRLGLVLKLAVNNPATYPLARLEYSAEIYMYESAFVVFERFQQEHGLQDGFSNHPKFYGKCTEEYKDALVMEDLFESGYKLWKRKVPMDGNHIELVMKEYGKFHAVSFAMRYKNPELYSKLVEGLPVRKLSQEDKDNIITILARTFENSITKVAKGDLEVEQTIRRSIEMVEQFLFFELEDESTKLVITHGDGWCNNMMFKYENPSEETYPTQVCLIDWQVPKPYHPVTDLCYFFGSSSERQILEDYMTYLKIYHESLSRSLSAMGCVSGAIYSFQTLVEDWNKFSKYMAYVAPVLIQLLLIDKEDAVDMETCKNPDDFMAQLESRGCNDAVRDRQYDLYKFLGKNGFI